MKGFDQFVMSSGGLLGSVVFSCINEISSNGSTMCSVNLDDKELFGNTEEFVGYWEKILS